MNIGKGIGLGIGFILGLIIVVMALVLLFWLCVSIIKFFMRYSFSLELFKRYQKELLKHEHFEELSEVNVIIEKMKKNEKPREILKNYTVKIESYFYWMPTMDGGERLTYRFDKQIKRYKNKNLRK